MGRLLGSQANWRGQLITLCEEWPWSVGEGGDAAAEESSVMQAVSGIARCGYAWMLVGSRTQTTAGDVFTSVAVRITWVEVLNK